MPATPNKAAPMMEAALCADAAPLVMEVVVAAAAELEAVLEAEFDVMMVTVGVADEAWKLAVPLTAPVPIG